MNTELQKKIMDAFIGKVVRKDLAFLVRGNLPVPTYVLEYLLGQYCASDDQEQIKQGLEKVKEVITNNYVQRQDAEMIKGLIHDQGRYRIIDNISVQLSERDDEYHASFANLGISHVPIGAQYVKQNPKLLSGNGVWCIVTVGYIPGENIKVRWEIQTLKPIQISNIDVQDYIAQRQKFSTDEWIDFLIHTVGLNPDVMNRREKFICLSRLLPHVENNFNLMELGPKGTGKSHIYQELSPYGVLVSGGDVTSARLFVKMSGNKEIIGLVGYWDVVAWDEFEQQKGTATDGKLIDIMQNYLANKKFNRGKGTHEASASMCFVGNTKHTVPYMLRNSHLFESIPNSFIKSAFLDRIHLYNPGWEVSILKKSSFSQDYGLITDYIAAVLHELRKVDYSQLISQYADFSKTLSQRDMEGINKTFSGFIKLLYPDGKFTDEEAYEIIDYATECRKRVKDQIYIIDATFVEQGIAQFEYTKPNGQKVQVETLERLENPNIIIKYSGESTPEPETEPEEAPAPEPVKEEPKLTSKHIDIRENQKGVSYKSLFGDYMRTAKKMTIIDPYIRAVFQIDNLVDLIRTFIESTTELEGLEIELHTYETDEKRPNLIDNLDQIQDDLARYNIEFTYAFDADHDRCIKLDNGWRMVLSRGIDIFEKFDRFSLSNQRQELRRCRAFSVTYLEE
ncbi:BREX system Lon protease-like protein BrxL [Prevotella sp. P4-119]|uniref:BREX system Lon protease-like protein BrxL n=1 Tax=Prevotella sp. P4-119 TaxID=2024218 RepID=UPI0020B16684|nr:BREX system Lon protease-like protein BrxL [Prevotella sp. P4-119]